MRLDLTKAFVTEGYSFTIDHQLALPDEDAEVFIGKIASPVNVRGRLYNKADVLNLSLETEYTVNGRCDRCCKDAGVSRTAKVDAVLVREKQDEDRDDLIVVDSNEFDIYETVMESILLDVPNKLLCSEDCKGLCPICGQDLNLKKCGCKNTVSPFDILKQDFTG